MSTTETLRAAPHIPNATDYLGCGDALDASCFGTIVTASPLTYASHDDPPAFLASSTDFTAGCESVEPQNSVEMVNALKARGVPVVFDTTNACGTPWRIGKARSTLQPPAR